MKMRTKNPLIPLFFLSSALCHGQTVASDALDKLSSLREAEAFNQMIVVGNEFLNDPEIYGEADQIYLHLLKAYIEVGRQNSISNKPEEVIRQYEEGSKIAEKLFALENSSGLDNRYYMSYENFYVQYFLYFKDMWEIDFMENAMQKLQDKQ